MPLGLSKPHCAHRAEVMVNYTAGRCRARHQDDGARAHSSWKQRRSRWRGRRGLETPSPLNPLGLEGVGESGTLPVPAVVAAAIEDALGVPVDRMPLTASLVRALLM
jgi:hypothetical protein